MPRALTLIVCLTPLWLTSCSGTGLVVSSVCAWDKPIYLNTEDQLSPETQRAVLTHDEAWQKVCGP